MIMKRVKIYSVVCLIAICLIAINGCKKTAEESSAPAVPNANTLSMDFTSLPTKTKSAAADITADSSNWKIASFTVGFWAIAAGGYTIIPAAAFKAVIDNGKPVYDDVNKVWEWKVSFTFALGTHEADLTAKLSEDSVHWTMKITTWVNTAQQSTDKWFEGTAAYSRTGGWWILYYKPVGSAEWKSCLKLDWKRENDNVGSLKYTNIIQGDTNNGGFIEFGSVATGNFDKYFKAKGKSDNVDINNKLCTIEWNSSTKVGHIIYNGYICGWDANLVNVACTLQ